MSETRAESAFEAYPGREANVGPIQVVRALPAKHRRLVGPWCFLDRFGPLTFEGSGMDVAPHPHIGIQTVSWLFDGELLHDDSLGSEAILHPRGVNIMTCGDGIAHSERTPSPNTGRISGVQLWVALPDENRHVAPSFQHVAEVPVSDARGCIIQVFAGQIGGLASPAQRYSDFVGADIQIPRSEAASIPLDPSYEHAVLVPDGDCAFEGQPLDERVLYYLGAGRSEASFRSRGGSRVLLIGGAPFGEKVLMWWNFVARTPEEIVKAKRDWDERNRRFGEVRAYKGERVPAPDFIRPLKN